MPIPCYRLWERTPRIPLFPGCVNCCDTHLPSADFPALQGVPYNRFSLYIKKSATSYLLLETVIRILLSRYHSNWRIVHFLMYKHTLLIYNGFGSRRCLLSRLSRFRTALERPFNNQFHTASHQLPFSGMILGCLLFFLIGFDAFTLPR